MSGRLTGVARDLGELMSDISEDVYAAGWIRGNEWILWRALRNWRASGGPAYWDPASPDFADITEYMPKLDQVQRAAGGWVWFLMHPDERGGMQFVPEERWLRLVEANAARPHLENEELDRDVPGASSNLPSGPPTRSECTCTCHQGDRRARHMVACCRPDSTAPAVSR